MPQLKATQVSKGAYVLVDHQMESVAPCWEDVVLQGSGAVVCVHHMAGLQNKIWDNN